MFELKVTPAAVEKVNAIAPRAIGLGWTTEELYQTTGRYPFPFGGEYGLVCFLHRERTIVDVTATAITLQAPPRGVILRFYRRSIGTLTTQEAHHG